MPPPVIHIGLQKKDDEPERDEKDRISEIRLRMEQQNQEQKSWNWSHERGEFGGGIKIQTVNEARGRISEYDEIQGCSLKISSKSENE
jgi:hypothetical protein